MERLFSYIHSIQLCASLSKSYLIAVLIDFNFSLEKISAQNRIQVRKKKNLSLALLSFTETYRHVRHKCCDVVMVFLLDRVFERICGKKKIVEGSSLGLH